MVQIDREYLTMLYEFYWLNFVNIKNKKKVHDCFSMPYKENGVLVNNGNLWS